MKIAVYLLVILAYFHASIARPSLREELRDLLDELDESSEKGMIGRYYSPDDEPDEDDEEDEDNTGRPKPSGRPPRPSPSGPPPSFRPSWPGRRPPRPSTMFPYKRMLGDDLFPSTLPPFPSGSPFTSDMPPLPSDFPAIPGLINHELRRTCPVIKEILPEYFEYFPSGPIKDAIQINPDRFRDTLRDLHTAFTIGKNHKLFAREFTAEVAEVVVEERFFCPAAKMQQAFVYFLRKELDVSLSSADDSLKSQLSNFLSKMMNDYDYLASEIVAYTHRILYEEMISFSEMQQFRELSTFMNKMSKKFSKILMKNSAWDRIMNFVTKYFEMNSDLFQCMPPSKFIQMHIGIASEFQERLTKDVLTKDTLVVAETLLKSALQDFNVDPSQYQTEIDGIVNLVTRYIKGGLESFRKYEEVLVGGTQPGDDFFGMLQRYISGDELEYFKRLWAHMTANSIPQ